MSEDFKSKLSVFGPTTSVDMLIKEVENWIESWASEHTEFKYFITNFEDLQSAQGKHIDLLDDLILTNSGLSCFAQLKIISTRKRPFADRRMIDLSKMFPDVFIETHSYGDCSGVRDFLIKDNKILAQRIFDLEEGPYRRGTTKLMEVYRLKELAA